MGSWLSALLAAAAGLWIVEVGWLAHVVSAAEAYAFARGAGQGGSMHG